MNRKTQPVVYLDNNATTPLTPDVLEATLPYLKDSFGNPSSPYELGRSAALAVDNARRQTARLIGVDPDRIIFTSGGTESNALALLGSLPGLKPRNEVILSAVEHASLWAWRERLAGMGYTVHVAPVDALGDLDLVALSDLLNDRTALITVMVANNETGIIYPIKKVVELAHAVGAKVHTDAVQAVGKVPINLYEIGVDYASVCGHKYHGNKGIGCLYIRDPDGFSPMLYGGEQEFGRRPGTEPVSSIVSLGAASATAIEWQRGRGPGELVSMRDDFESRLEAVVKDIVVVGRGQPRLPNTSLLLIPGIETEPLLALLDMEGIACSSGSACASGAHEPSHVLKAMQLASDGVAVLRVSSSRLTKRGDYNRLLEILPGLIQRLRYGSTRLNEAAAGDGKKPVVI